MSFIPVTFYAADRPQNDYEAPIVSSRRVTSPFSIALSLLAMCALIFSPLSVNARPISPSEAPRPALMFAQMDDPELVRELSNEETLGQLQEIEFERDSLSLSKGIIYSLIPGGSWGLFYAKKRAQGLIPLLLSVVGYGLGATYLSGTFDTASTDVCVYTPTQELVSMATCSRGEPTPSRPQQHLDYDERSWVDSNGDGQKQPDEVKRYFQTQGDYTTETRGKNEEFGDLGLTILVGTYVVTTVIGAIWAGSSISTHNDELRKKIESTAQAPIKVNPTLVYDGRNALMGLSVQF